MTINWEIISSAATAFGSVATAIGIVFGARQIKITKDQAQAAFEDGLDQQYRVLSMDIPVGVLIGEPVAETDRTHVRELIYNYLDLTNEQVYLRSKGRITKQTWESWRAGMQMHIEKPAFRSVYDEVSERSGFTYLRKLVETNYSCDPVGWSRNKITLNNGEKND